MKNKQLTREEQLRIKSRWKKSGIKISKELRDIIHGYIMSDGYLRKGVLTVDQSKKQKRFVEWLYKQMKPLRTDYYIQEVVRTHSKQKTISYSVRFNTRSVLGGFHRMWYEPFQDIQGKLRYKKKLPNSIHCFFKAVFISLWFAGDGTKVLGSKGAKFEVTSFTVEERLYLKKLFLKQLNINTQIIRSGITKTQKEQWALKVGAGDYETFRQLITTFDLIPTLFPYKLHKKE